METMANDQGVKWQVTEWDPVNQGSSYSQMKNLMIQAWKRPRRQTEWKINMGRIYGGGRKKGLRLESTEWGRNWKVPVKNTDESKERVKWGITEQTELLGSDHWKSMRDVLSRAGVSSRYSTLRTKHAVSLLSEHSRKTHGLSLYFHPCPVLTV